ncbi:UNVERIFIED_CONTAM: hypothetical protein Sradi_3244700 [Sesamum radiatum]|uniref:Uncharacterized protein n=1 Tax=Sesamum radiatum TaxID=300843 RepID=A0AAW2QZF0_SESRA
MPPGRPVRSSQGCWRSQHARPLPLACSDLATTRTASCSDCTTTRLRKLAANNELAAITRSGEPAVAK